MTACLTSSLASAVEGLLLTVVMNCTVLPNEDSASISQLLLPMLNAMSSPAMERFVPPSHAVFVHARYASGPGLSVGEVVGTVPAAVITALLGSGVPTAAFLAPLHPVRAKRATVTNAVPLNLFMICTLP